MLSGERSTSVRMNCPRMVAGVSHLCSAFAFGDVDDPRVAAVEASATFCVVICEAALIADAGAGVLRASDSAGRAGFGGTTILGGAGRCRFCEIAGRIPGFALAIGRGICGCCGKVIGRGICRAGICCRMAGTWRGVCTGGRGSGWAGGGIVGGVELESWPAKSLRISSHERFFCPGFLPDFASTAPTTQIATTITKMMTDPSAADVASIIGIE